MKAGPMVRFTTTCEHHQRRFMALMARNGVEDPMRLERIRRAFGVAVAKTYPATFRDRIRKGECIGCVFDDSGEACRQWMVDALTALVRGYELPHIAVRTWESTAYKHPDDVDWDPDS
jgi:hypothetical protein